MLVSVYCSLRHFPKTTFCFFIKEHSVLRSDIHAFLGPELRVVLALSKNRHRCFFLRKQ